MTWKIPAGMSEKKAEREARHQAELFEEKVRTGQNAEQKIKFADFCDLWMKDYAETQLRPKTVNRYRELLERIKPALGSIYIDRLRPTHLTAFYRELSQVRKASSYTAAIDLKTYLKERKITQVKLSEDAEICTCTIRSIILGNPANQETAKKIAGALRIDFDKLFQPVGEPEYLSGQTILHYHRLISVILQTAVEWQYIPANPAERVKPPKAESNEAVYLDDKQAIRLLELMQDQPIYYRTAVTVLLFTGMRRGELMGLTWSDIDFDNNTITIQRSLQYLPDMGVFTSDTKTKSSRRVIKAPASAIHALKEYRKWQRRTFLSIGQAWEETAPVFVTQCGTPMHPDTLTSWFGSFIKTTDLPQIHIHSLRHTNATLQIANGVAVTTVAGTLGHSTANTTTKVYAHAIQSAAAASAEMMDNLLNPIKKQA
jgi:integrase